MNGRRVTWLAPQRPVEGGTVFIKPGFAHLAERTYPGAIAAVHDGDTLTVTLDLGFRLSQLVDVRLVGLNAIELAKPGGHEAGAHLLGLAPAGAPCTVTVTGVDKFGGRFDAVVVVGGVDVGQRMIADGYAAAWDGKGPKPVPPWPLPAAPLPNSGGLHQLYPTEGESC